MREILFRGKRIDNGEWVEGTPFQEYDNFWDEWVWIIKTRHPLSDVPFMRFKIDRESLSQFTGLTDKNGKKVFEGDIIKFHKYRGEPDWVGEVRYENCTYLAVGTMPLAYEKQIDKKPFHGRFEVVMSSIEKTTIEVIGNIHDNPEILEEQYKAMARYFEILQKRAEIEGVSIG